MKPTSLILALSLVCSTAAADPEVGRFVETGPGAYTITVYVGQTATDLAPFLGGGFGFTSGVASARSLHSRRTGRAIQVHGLRTGTVATSVPLAGGGRGRLTIHVVARGAGVVATDPFESDEDAVARAARGRVVPTEPWRDPASRPRVIATEPWRPPFNELVESGNGRFDVWVRPRKGATLPAPFLAEDFRHFDRSVALTEGYLRRTRGNIFYVFGLRPGDTTARFLYEKDGRVAEGTLHVHVRAKEPEPRDPAAPGLSDVMGNPYALPALMVVQLRIWRERAIQPERTGFGRYAATVCAGQRTLIALPDAEQMPGRLPDGVLSPGPGVLVVNRTAAGDIVVPLRRSGRTPSGALVIRVRPCPHADAAGHAHDIRPDDPIMQWFESLKRGDR